MSKIRYSISRLTLALAMLASAGTPIVKVSAEGAGDLAGVSASGGVDGTDGPGGASNETKVPHDFGTDLIIKSVNPGYKVDGVSEVGELIEIANLSGQAIDLNGLELHYIYKPEDPSKTKTYMKLGEGYVLDGDTLFLAYTKSSLKDKVPLTYSYGMSYTTGGLELIYAGEVIDAVCWRGGTECVESFSSSNPTSLVRNLYTGEFEHDKKYVPDLTGAKEKLVLIPPKLELEEDGMGGAEEPEENAASAAPVCRTIELSEILTYYIDDKSEQFIEFYNAGTEAIELSPCKIKYKNKLYGLAGTVPAEGYLALNIGVSLTKNPTTANEVSLIDADNVEVDKVSYPHGQKKGTAWARFFDENGAGAWAITYSPTPGAENNYQEYQTCPAGKVINPATGNCVNTTSLKSSTTTLAECPAGKYRNPLTGRCKSLETASTLKPCAEGYERNPLTNRCRKIVTENTGTEYAIATTSADNSKKVFAGAWIVAGVVGIGGVYIILQFRREIARAGRKASKRLHDTFEHLVARKGGRNGDKNA